MKFFEIFPPIGVFGNPEVTGPTAIHSGNLGDIIYSIPTMQKLGIAHLVLNICSDPFFAGRILTRESALWMGQFLIDQGVVKKASVVATNIPFDYADLRMLDIDFVLDRFRSKGLDNRTHLVFQHATPYNVAVDPRPAWLKNPNRHVPLSDSANYIVVGLTSRYRRFDNGFYEHLLREIPPENIVFLGSQADQMERCNLQGEFVPTNNFSELATIIANAKLFVGNPSFLFALAEGLKVRRWLEVPENGNVYPLDSSGNMIHQHTQMRVRRDISDLLGLKGDRVLELLRLSLEEEVKFMEKHLEALRKSEAEMLRKKEIQIQTFPYRKRYLYIDRIFKALGRP